MSRIQDKERGTLKGLGVPRTGNMMTRGNVVELT
jgi:hypothetical protein